MTNLPFFPRLGISVDMTASRSTPATHLKLTDTPVKRIRRRFVGGSEELRASLGEDHMRAKSDRR